MKTKRFLAAILAVMMLVSTFAFSASASNQDGNFHIHMSSPGVVASSSYAARVKEDSTSSYINYNTIVGGNAASGPYQFEAQIWGAYAPEGPYKDCSSYTKSGLPRTKAIITRGTVGLMRQDVYEWFGDNSVAQIYGAMISESGIANGCWSADSVGSYNYYNRLA